MATLALTLSCRSCRLLSNPAFTRCLSSPLNVSITPTYQSSCRYYSKKHPMEIKPPGKVKVKAVGSAVRYLDRASQKFEDRFPTVYKVYKILKDGVAGFYADAKVYLQVTRALYSGTEFSRLKRAEIETYRQLPGDFRKVFLVLLLAPWPFTGYILLPLIYLFPRQLLSRHFWTPEQKLEFGLYYLKPRLEVYPEIFDYLERHSKDILDKKEKEHFQACLHKLNKGNQLTVDEILRSKPLFESRPFGLNHLAKYHRIEFSHVAKSMGLSTVSKQNLLQGALMIHNIDQAIYKEGLDSMSLDDLQQACFTRSLNVVDLSRKDLEDYLKKWLAISKSVQSEESASLLLHSPVLLGYAMPSNRKWFITKRES